MKKLNIYTVGTVSDQITNNHASWVVASKTFNDLESARKYADEQTTIDLDNGVSGHSWVIISEGEIL